MNDLKIQLTRLPLQARFNLHSSMETVLDAYLAQDSAGMEALLEEAFQPFQHATDETMQLFARQYEQSQGWDTAAFDRIITQGCFPLHPLTTALFCNVHFGEAQGQRSVLGFVLTELQKKLDQPALTDGVPNWIYATALVDWFGSMLGEADFAQYEHSRKKLGGDITPIEEGVLKAVLLFHIGQLKLGRVAFERAVAQMNGYRSQQCRETLEDLDRRGILRRDESRRTYSFWAQGVGPGLVLDMLKREVPNKKLDWPVLEQLNEEWSGDRLKPAEVDAALGNPQDWACREVLLTREFFTPACLQRLAPLFRLDSSKGLQDGARGVLVRLVAETEDDVEFFRQEAPAVLGQASGRIPLPLMVAVPFEPHPLLPLNIKRELLLRGLPQQRRTDLGAEACASVEQHTRRAIDDELARLREHATYHVPPEFRAEINQRGWQEDGRKVAQVAYRLAYTNNPRSFLTQYPADRLNLRRAVALVSRLLLTNRVVGEPDKVQENAVARDLVGKILRVGSPGSWEILTVSHVIREPGQARVRAAWDVLERLFAPGCSCVPLKDAVLPLLNPPFGLDYNQVTLLFCAWYGYHSHELQAASGAKTASILDHVAKLDQPRAFMAHLLHVEQIRLSRVDQAGVETAIRKLITRVRQVQLSRDEAKAAIKELSEYASEERNNPELRRTAQTTAEALQRDLQLADTYVNEVQTIRDKMKAGSLDRLLPLFDQIGRLPQLGCVAEASCTKADVLNREVTEALKNGIEPECHRLEGLAKLTDYSLNHQRLTQLKTRLSRVGLPELESRVNTALQRLEDKKQQLEARQRDEALLVHVGHMAPDRSLAELRDYLGQLSKLTPHSDAAIRAVDRKRAELEAAVSKLTSLLAALEERLGQVASVRAARNLAAEIDRSYNRFNATLEQKQLDTAAERLKALENLFQALDSASQRNPSTQNAADELLRQLDQQRASLTGLTATQLQVITGTEAKLRSLVEGKRREAQSWLARLEQDARAGKPAGDLLRRAEGAPPFLPTQDAERLRQLMEQLRARSEEEARERELRNRDAELRAQLQALNPRAPLRDLYAGLELLTTLEPQAESTRATLNERRLALQTAAERLSADLVALEARADAVMNVVQVRQLTDDLHRAQSQYEGAPEAQCLSAVVERSRTLEAAFQRVEAIRKASAKTPAELEALAAHLSAAEQEALAATTERQRALFDMARESLADVRQRGEAAALRWLAEQEAHLERRAHLSALLRSLDSPPPFLPVASSNRLQVLREAAEAAVAGERREVALRQEVQALSTELPLAALRERLCFLRELQTTDTETWRLVETKSAAIEAAALQARSRVEELEKRVAALAAADQARKLQGEIQGTISRYEGTPEGQQLMAALERIAALLGLFERLREVETTPVVSPADVERLTGTVECLRREQDGALSLEQGGIFAGVLRKIEEKRAAKEQEAEQWVRSCERDATSPNQVHAVLGRLDQPPAFLVPKHEPVLAALRHQLQERVDGDALLAVETHFRRIRDAGKRAECLARLQELMRELERA